MQKLISVLAAILATFLVAPNAGADRSAPAQIQDQISAELSITNDSIAQLLRKMAEKSQTNDGLQHADYIVKAQHEHELAEQATDAFKTFLKEKLFVEIHATLANYNNIYVSDAYTPQQKAELLRNTSSVVSGFFEEASARYRTALYKLYEALGPGFASVNAEAKHLDYEDYNRGSDPGDINFGFAKTDYYTAVVVPGLLNGCYSRSCVSNSASDEIVFYTLVRSLFGQPIIFKGLDGTAFTLNNGINWDDSSQISDEFIKLLSDELDYPAAIKSLPFDIDSAAYGQAVAKNPPKTSETCKSHWDHKCSN